MTLAGSLLSGAAPDELVNRCFSPFSAQKYGSQPRFWGRDYRSAPLLDKAYFGNFFRIFLHQNQSLISSDFFSPRSASKSLPESRIANSSSLPSARAAGPIPEEGLYRLCSFSSVDYR